MDIGKIGVLIGLFASVAAIALYALSLRGNRRVLWAARAAYALTAASAAFCFGRLMWLVSTKQFQYKYVFDYSSADLASPWKYAATWAGQEGSFLLWALWTAIIGGLVLWKAGRWESRVMPFYVSALTFLFAILIWLSPYNLLLRGGPNGFPVEWPWPPINGKGLHPSLQNYWMAIHPPTIFFGFASLAVPFCYAIAAMLWREYETWATRVMPWVLMTVATLGVGLFMGGYWAYETQGWHGFWAWDPVENASLFPWLGALALLHGLVVQKSRGGMGRTNLFLAVVSWLLFLYGTFLTRSGVLSNFSVHSFVSLENKALYLLIGMIAFYGLSGVALLAWRWRKIPGRPISDKMLSRDTAMVLAITLMIAACAIIAIGTSWPMLSQWPLLKSIPGLANFTAAKGVAAQPIFYNKVGAALLIPTLIFMGMVPLLAWGHTNLEKFLWKVLVPWFAALGGGFLILWFVLYELRSGFRPATEQISAGTGFNPDTPRTLIVTIGTLGLFAAISNLLLAVKLLRVKAVTMGGWLAHVGIGLLFVGTIITNVYEKTDTFNLIEGDAPQATPFGYSLQFAGWTHSDKLKQADEAADPQERERLMKEVQEDWWKFDHGVKIRVIPQESGAGVAHADDPGSAAESKNSFIAVTRVFHSQSLMMNQEENSPQTMRWPYIHKDPFRDFYLYVASDPKRFRVNATLLPGETKPIHGTKYSVTYHKFYMHGAPGQAGTEMGAEMELTTPDGRKVAIKPGKRFTPEGGMAPVNTQIPEIESAVILRGGIHPATKEATVEFEFPNAPPLWVVPLMVTNKPMINLVWLGVILMGLGTLCAMTRRSLEARKNIVLATAAAAGVGDAPVTAPVVPVKNGHEGANGAGGAKAKTRPRRHARPRA